MSIDASKIMKGDYVMGFIDVIKEKAKADKKTIVLPESMDRRTFVAAEKILKEGLANLIIIGTPEEVAANSEGLDISGATIVNPFTYEKTEEYVNLFVELRKSKGPRSRPERPCSRTTLTTAA